LNRWKRALVGLVLVVIVSISLLGAGCGGNTPEGAAKKFLDAWSSGNWESFKKTVLPEDAKLTKEEDELARQMFEQVKVKFNGIKMKTTYDSKDKNKATVELTGGKIFFTAKISGKVETRSEDIAKMDKSSRPSLACMRRNGTWFVHQEVGFMMTRRGFMPD